ncbi:MAG: hypothetical protein ACLFQV_08040 [Vulcanimicrobiota bacterium]
MVLPKGNPLIEDLKLNFPDINVMMNNLEQQSFTGYLKFDLNTGIIIVIFYKHGVITRAVEIKDDAINVQPQSRLLNKLKGEEVNVSTYIVSPRIVDVVESNFAFQPLYLDYDVRERELKKVMTTLEESAYTGFIEFDSKEEKLYILIDRGEILTDFFASRFGDIVAGTGAVSDFLNQVSSEGAVINVYAEKQDEIEAKKHQKDEELEKIKQLLVKEEKGFFKAGDIFWIDEYILQEWGLRNVKTFNLELEAPDGSLYIVKSQPSKRLGGYISTIANNMKKHNLQEGDLVSVRPV